MWTYHIYLLWLYKHQWDTLTLLREYIILTIENIAKMRSRFVNYRTIIQGLSIWPFCHVYHNETEMLSQLEHISL